MRASTDGRKLVLVTAVLVASAMAAAVPGLGMATSTPPARPALPGRALMAEGPRSSCPASSPTAFGLPRWELCGIGGQYLTSPVVGTIDGQKVVVDGSESGLVNVVNARTGEEMPGWPERADLVGNTATAIDSSPVIAYLDGPNREPSIVVGLGTLEERCQNGGVMAWNYNGRLRFRFLTRKTFSEWRGCPASYTNGVFDTPAVGDVTGNGQQDIVFGSWDHYLYALNPQGKVLRGFPINRADTIWSSPALADVTHTGKMDIIEGSDANGWRGPNGGPKCFSGWVSDYRYEDGAPRLVWEHCLAETVWSSPAVTTFGSTPVVVVGTSFFSGAGLHVQPAEDEVFAYDAANGRPISGWPVNTGGATFGSPAVGPAYPGGPTDVFASSCANCPTTGDARVTAWNEKGHLLWSRNITTYGELLSSPTLANVTDFKSHGLADNDILIGNVLGLFVLSARTGNYLAGTSSTEAIDKGCYVGGAPAVAAVPGSKTGYMMFTNCGYHPAMTVPTYLRGYDVPPPSDPYPWPMFHANAQHTGIPDPTSTTPIACSTPAAPSGYRVFGQAGAVAGFGAAENCGGLSDRILPEDVAGMASTPNGGGYWLALKDGAVYAFGDARFHGDLRTRSWRGGPAAPGAPVTGISSSPDGKGYFLLAGDGSVYAFGDARYHGSNGDYRSAGTPLAIVTDDATGGYWVATSSGAVYNFDAPFFGSKPDGHASPMVGMAASSGDHGYWLVTASGYVYHFGKAASYGSSPGNRVVGLTGAVGGNGYYLVTSNGTILCHGRAPNAGTQASLGGEPVAGISAP